MLDQLDPSTHARLDDPATSHAAAARLRKRTTIIRLLRAYSAAPLHGLTAEEACERAGLTPADGGWKRVSDLQRLGLIEPCVDDFNRSVTRTGASGRQQRVLSITGLGVAALT